MRVGIASDHRGYKVKEKLKKYFVKKSIEFVDYGTDSEEIVDYPVFATSVCKGVISGEVECGILICGTGIGMSIALNKVKGVYCAKISSINEAVLCRQHNNANAIAFSADIDQELAKEMVDKFLETTFLDADKYKRRNKMIKDREKND